MNLRFVDAKAAAFFFIVAGPAVSYLIPAGNFISYGLSALLFSYAFFCGRIRFSGRLSQWVLISAMMLMIVLSFLLLLFGTPGEFNNRYIVFYSILQLAGAFLIFNIRNEADSLRIVMAMILAGSLEVIIVMGQFSYITFGWGFSKIKEYESSYGLITGSMGNPNDSAAYIGVLALATSVFFATRRKFRYAFLCLAVVLPPIFLTLSRTVTVFWLINLLMIFIAANFGVARERISRSNLSVYVLAFLLAAAVAAFFIGLDAIESEVFNRSTDRISRLSNIGDDGSIGSRIISHTRLLENFGNLGVGSFSDLNYYQFFTSSDDWLMKVNPHSYIVEYSFLFGYIGFFTIMLLFTRVVLTIGANKNIDFGLRVVACLGLFFIQAVPSSLITSVYFVLPFIFIGNLKEPSSLKITEGKNLAGRQAGRVAGWQGGRVA